MNVTILKRVPCSDADGLRRRNRTVSGFSWQEDLATGCVSFGSMAGQVETPMSIGGRCLFFVRLALQFLPLMQLF